MAARSAEAEKLSFRALEIPSEHLKTELEDVPLPPNQRKFGRVLSSQIVALGLLFRMVGLQL